MTINQINIKFGYKNIIYIEIYVVVIIPAVLTPQPKLKRCLPGVLL